MIHTPICLSSCDAQNNIHISESHLGPAWPPLPPTWSPDFSLSACPPFNVYAFSPDIAASSSVMPFLQLLSYSVVSCGDMVCLGLVVASALSLSFSLSLSLSLPVCLSACLSACLSVCLSVCLCLSVGLSVCLSLSPSLLSLSLSLASLLQLLVHKPLYTWALTQTTYH